MLNRWTGIGRLVADPEVKYLPSGVSVATFKLAVDDNFKGQDGERKTAFIPIVCWKGLADAVGKYLTKGRLAAVSGRIQTRTYDAQDGTKRYITEIVTDEVQFLERAKEPLQEQAPPIDKPEFVPIDGTDDDLPF